MDRAERALYHQIHPAKLAADIAAELASTVLLWRHHLAGGLLIRLVPPVVASAFVLRRTTDLERLRASAAGRYVRDNMTSQAQGARALGDVLTAVGAWRRRPLIIGAGAALIAGGWLAGCWRGTSDEGRSRSPPARGGVPQATAGLEASRGSDRAGDKPGRKDPTSILSRVVLGAIAGFLANLLVGRREGLIGTIILGMIGAVVGGYLAQAVLHKGDVTGVNIESIVTAVGRGDHRPVRLACPQGEQTFLMGAGRT